MTNINNSLSTDTSSNTHRDNLNRAQRTTLNKLSKRKDIIIRKSDKGDTIVVETTDRYITDGLQHLSDEQIYHRLSNDITQETHKTITSFIEHCFKRGLINHDIYKFLTSADQIDTPIIYFLKKLHKNPISVRPIVSNINSPTRLLSLFIDKLLKPIVETKQHILRNSTNVIIELEQLHLTDNSILVTADVKSLYPSIPIDESIEVILGYLEDQKDPTNPPIYVLKQILNYILHYNCFQFCDLHFLQVRGVAMGTPMAPNYANLYMSHLEENYIFKLPNQPTYYRRYIDDILLIYDHSTEKLTQFQSELNSIRPTIQFTFETSTTTVTYLDINIIKDNNRIRIEPHFKPTNTFSYVKPSSNHHNSVFKGIYRGENIRILRNSTTETTYLQTMDFLKHKFQNRGYINIIARNPPEPFDTRSQHLTATSESRSPSLTIVSTLDRNRNFIKAIKDNWTIFANDQDTRKNLYTKPIRFSHTNHPSIQQKVTRSRIEQTIPSCNSKLYPPPTINRINYPARNIKCRTTGCASCPQLQESHQCVSYQTRKSHPIHNIYSCDTKFAIYLLECPKCFKQYIGETGQTIRNRMRHHRNASNKEINRPIYHHLKEHAIPFQAFKLTIIKQVHNTDERKKQELALIKQFKTHLPFGLNVIKKS